MKENQLERQSINQSINLPIFFHLFQAPSAPPSEPSLHLSTQSSSRHPLATRLHHLLRFTFRPCSSVCIYHIVYSLRLPKTLSFSKKSSSNPGTPIFSPRGATSILRQLGSEFPLLPRFIDYSQPGARLFLANQANQPWYYLCSYSRNTLLLLVEDQSHSAIRD